MSARGSTGLRTAAILDFIAQFTNCVIDCYDGVQPQSADNPPAANRIGRITESGGAFVHGTATNGLNMDSDGDGTLSIAAGETWIFTSEQAGLITWARMKTNATDANGQSTTQKRLDFSVGLTTGNLQLTRVEYTASGQQATITVFDLSILARGVN